MFFIRRKKINIFACVPVCVIPQIHINFFKHSPKTDINLLFGFYCKPAFHSRHATTTKNACNTTTEFLLCAKMQNMHLMNFWCLILTFDILQMLFLLYKESGMLAIRCYCVDWHMLHNTMIYVCRLKGFCRNFKFVLVWSSKY